MTTPTAELLAAAEKLRAFADRIDYALAVHEPRGPLDPCDHHPTAWAPECRTCHETWPCREVQPILAAARVINAS